jgi:hypothetical protein
MGTEMDAAGIARATSEEVLIDVKLSSTLGRHVFHLGRYCSRSRQMRRIAARGCAENLATGDEYDRSEHGRTTDDEEACRH